MVTITNGNGNRSRSRINALSNNTLQHIFRTGNFTARQLARLREVSQRFRGIINRNRTLLPGRGGNYTREHNRALQEQLRITPILAYYYRRNGQFPPNLHLHFGRQRAVARRAHINLGRFLGLEPGPFNLPPAYRSRMIRNANAQNHPVNRIALGNQEIRRRALKIAQFARRYSSN